MINYKHLPLRILSLFYKNFNSFSSYTQSKQFWRQPAKQPNLRAISPEGVQQSLLGYILQHCPKNQPNKTMQFIDKYCLQNWMMNLGPQKSKILDKIITQNKIKKILQIGTYCGYSAIALNQADNQSQKKIVSMQINKKVADIAKKIINHSGIKNIHIYTETIYQARSLLNQLGPFDMVFMDQEQDQYLPDLLFLQQRNLIKTGSIIVADNVGFKQAEKYVDFMKRNIEDKSFRYRSIYYHTYDAYTDIPDGVMVSYKLF